MHEKEQSVSEIKNQKGFHRLRIRLHEIIFEADTRAGKWFDLILILSILSSVLVVMLDSVAAVKVSHGNLLYGIEWGFTLLFTLEYLLRLFCVTKPLRYAFSFLGLVDLLAVLPTYVSLVLPGSQYMLVIRILRVLRVFRVLKLASYVGEAAILMQALLASRRKITIFLLAIISLVVIFGSLMYLIEGPENGFTSIPRSIYWAIVTMTTVGYGDISPKTNLGQSLASVIMILGYAIIAVPTGIVTAQLNHAGRKKISTQACPACMALGHDPDAVFCKFCSERLNPASGQENLIGPVKPSDEHVTAFDIRK
ncbi:ion transporter [Desulfobacter latus]|uniref:Ion transporter n=2 Tax=Desulfobacter latus TaxID=2292 RepID=A0A850TCV6_9BACT|nr:ion transporter [Desulfobacter latus]NWH06097.1 ion transporter [Desulfobacter latus]